MSKGVEGEYFTRLAHESSKTYVQWGPWDLGFYSFPKDLPASEIDPPPPPTTSRLQGERVDNYTKEPGYDSIL